MPGGPGPIGEEAILRVFKSKRPMPNRRECTIGSVELNTDTYTPGSVIESSCPPNEIDSMPGRSGFESGRRPTTVKSEDFTMTTASRNWDRYLHSAEIWKPPPRTPPPRSSPSGPHTVG